jgi:hypothetical protein
LFKAFHEIKDILEGPSSATNVKALEIETRMCELTAEQTHLKYMLAYQETMLLLFGPDSENVLMAIQLMAKAVSYPFDLNSSQPEYDGSIVDLEALHIQPDSGRI